ncbi:MAG TPA: nucleotidyl transferase AbiEii/AbiGii toxin family protein [Terracidiphilus sp.]|nr:nucleotidyl transferase AbiEii/AbiGii toxin family protein [Terracidiphilus sp.]
MTPPKTYATAGAFRRALEERLKSMSMTEQVDVNRLRRQVSFDRLLARLFRDDAAPWVLKGGYALELRFKSARSTIDIDLTVQRVTGAVDDRDAVRAIREMLQARADVSLDDWFEFTIGAPTMDLLAAPYGGARYSIEARMDGRIFARFHLDAGVGDVILQPLETVECHGWLSFAGIESPRVRVISREQQFAEKIHAYTLPRSSQNSRVKDLADLALLIGDGQLDRQRAVNALRLTFARRNTHALPASLSAPPEDWQTPFQALAEECGIDSKIAAVFDRVRIFFEDAVKGSMER